MARASVRWFEVAQRPVERRFIRRFSMKRKDVTFFGMSGEEHEVRCATAAQARKQLSRIYAMPCEAVLILTRESHAPVSDGDQELFNSTTCFSVVVDAEKMLLHFLNFFRGTSWPFRSMQQLEEHRGFLRIQKQKRSYGQAATRSYHDQCWDHSLRQKRLWTTSEPLEGVLLSIFEIDRSQL